MIEALLEAIHTAPDDDAPRLVFADALIERGDPRGEFIVRQCRGDAASDLALAHGDDWVAPIRPLLREYRFERGFLATCSLVSPRPEQAIAAAVGHPMWSTVRDLRGSAAIGLHPTMRALTTLGVDNELTHWRELLEGTPRPGIVELHYRPVVHEDWHSAGDITATPQSGGEWTWRHVPEELAALSRCAALPKLRKLSLVGLTGDSLAIVLGGPILDRVSSIAAYDGPVNVRIAGGLAVVTVDPRVAGTVAIVVLELVRGLPAHIGIELVAPPDFIGRARLEQMLGPRLRQGTRR